MVNAHKSYSIFTNLLMKKNSLQFFFFKCFGCSFPDLRVREMAVAWIHELNNDELVDYLPQLLQALKHETYEASPLARFLLERALLSPRVAHHIYWLLTQALPGQSPQVLQQVGSSFYAI